MILRLDEAKGAATPAEPRPVELSRIEQELASYLQPSSTHDNGTTIIRACSCNLVVIARNRQETFALPFVLAAVSESHPCRSIITCRGAVTDQSEDSDSSPLQAWISAHYSAPRASGQIICCEIITVTAPGNVGSEDLANTLVRLLVPDLPAFVYCRSFRADDIDLIERIAQFAHLLLFDSHSTKGDAENRRQLQQSLATFSKHIAVRDLNWSRLNAWRDLIAQFFKPTSLRHYVREVTEVEICRNLDSPGSLPTRTLLLMGWLASSLGWKLLSAQRSGDEWISRWGNGSDQVLARFTGSVTSPDQPSGISAITLRTRSGAVFSVTRKEGDPRLIAKATGIESAFSHSVIQEPMDEASLLIRELSLIGKDQVFESAFGQASALERSFRI